MDPITLPQLTGETMRGPSFFRSIQTIIAGSTIAILLLAMGAVLWYYPANQREAL